MRELAKISHKNYQLTFLKASIKIEWCLYFAQEITGTDIHIKMFEDKFEAEGLLKKFNKTKNALSGF